MVIRHIIHPLLKIEHHMNLIYPTSLVLKNDGREVIYQLLNEPGGIQGKTGIDILEKGTRDADIPFSGGYICQGKHFHHPWTHRGYLSANSSGDAVARLFAEALDRWKAGGRSEALYQLGRALHLLQDIFVPHHAGISAVRGHGALESWLLENGKPYQVEDGGYYEWEESFYNQEQDIWHHVTSSKPYDWIDHGSHISTDWYNKYFNRWIYDPSLFPQLGPLIIPNVMRFSAGFINKFFGEAGIL